MIEKLIEQVQELNANLSIDASDLDSFFRSRRLSKNEILLSSNAVCRNYYFVHKGVLRIFFLKDGRDYTSWFAFENYFFTELESYTHQTFSNYSIVAIEETEVLEIRKADMNDLLAKYSWWKDFLLFSQQKTIIKLTEHICSFQSKTARERYEELFGCPELIQRTRQKDLSSMIGITRHSLSRIRKK